MDWWQLVVLLAVVAGYIIKHIIAAQQDAAAAQRDHARSLPAAVIPKEDRELAEEKTDLDRRIEEAAERRREEEPSPIASRRHIPMPAPSAVVVKPRRVPRYMPPSASEERALPEVVVPARSEWPRVVTPLSAKPPASIPLPAIAPEAPKLAAMMAKSDPPAPVVVPMLAPVTTTKKTSAAVKQALELIKNRQSLAAAFMLREVLDRPVSKRRRGRR
jgi:hypothetical protein